MMAATELKDRGWSTCRALQYSGATRTALYYEKTPRRISPDGQTVMHVERIGKQVRGHLPSSVRHELA